MAYDPANVQNSKKAYLVFREIVLSEDLVSAAEVADKLETNRSTVSQIISSLNELNLVIKHRKGLSVKYELNYETCLGRIRTHIFENADGDKMLRNFHKTVGNTRPDLDKFNQFYINYIHNYCNYIVESTIEKLLIEDFIHGFLNRFKESKETPDWISQILLMIDDKKERRFNPSDIVHLTFEDYKTEDYSIEKTVDEEILEKAQEHSQKDIDEITDNSH